MTPAIPTTDHDEGAPPLHVRDVGHLVRVLIDGRRWAMMSPGDPVAKILLGIEPETAPTPSTKRPPQ